LATQWIKPNYLYLEEFDNMIFLCSPSVVNLDDLRKSNLYISDIPVHEALLGVLGIRDNWQNNFRDKG